MLVMMSMVPIVTWGLKGRRGRRRLSLLSAAALLPLLAAVPVG